MEDSSQSQRLFFAFDSPSRNCFVEIVCADVLCRTDRSDERSVIPVWLRPGLTRMDA